MDDIYDYIAHTLSAPHSALTLLDQFETSILSLETMPYRFPQRTTGTYANRGYRQIFVGNFTIVFRIDPIQNTVFIVTVKYAKSGF